MSALQQILAAITAQNRLLTELGVRVGEAVKFSQDAAILAADAKAVAQQIHDAITTPPEEGSSG